jgi:leucyl-tRNA synthetase
MEKTFISSAYIYPICPLNINHARMFVIGDIMARYSRMKGKSVFFPIASHYSGNTAQHVSRAFINIFSKNNVITEEEKKILGLYKDMYNMPIAILKTFTDPLNILNFYNQEILWELKSLDVSGDYEYSYTTKHRDFSVFIKTIISLYKKNDLLVYNKNKELALNYDNSRWKKRAFDLLNRTKFIQPFHRNNIISAMQHVRSDWGLLRKNGFGAAYNKKWIVDPMFDSELFTIFDLYIRFKKESEDKSVSAKDAFKNLFEVLNNKKKPESALVNKIIQWLPCDIFICEEHLKNWVVKKLFAESILLDKKYQTKKYFILGMGLLNGKRMSASRGNAILASNLINYYGPTKARLIIILQGGHPSKTYTYDHNLPGQIDKLLANFTSWYTYLLSLANKEIRIKNTNKEELPIKIICDTIEGNIDGGYYRQAVTELLSILPKKYKVRTAKSARSLIAIYKKYLGVLLPSLLKGFDIQN